MPEIKQDKQRNDAIDFLKAFAIVGVLFIHACAAGYYKPGSFMPGAALPSPDWISCLLLGTISRASVPIFLMCTGALMLDPERNVTLKSLWRHSIPRLLVALLVWAAIYRLYHLFTEGVPVSRWPVEAVKAILLFRHESFLYYLDIALFLYALLPALRAIAAQGSKETLRYLLLLWAVIGLILPTCRSHWPLNLLAGIPTQFPLNLTYSSMGYALLGWYLSRYARTSWKWGAAGALGYLSVFAITLYESVRLQRLSDVALNALFPGVGLAAAGAGGWAFAWFRERGVPRWVTLLAKASFCIYLSHMLFLYVLRNAGLSALSGPCILSVPATVALMLAASLAVYFALRRVPVVGRLLT